MRVATIAKQTKIGLHYEIFRRLHCRFGVGFVVMLPRQIAASRTAGSPVCRSEVRPQTPSRPYKPIRERTRTRGFALNPASVAVRTVSGGRNVKHDFATASQWLFDYPDFQNPIRNRSVARLARPSETKPFNCCLVVRNVLSTSCEIRRLNLRNCEINREEAKHLCSLTAPQP